MRAHVSVEDLRIIKQFMNSLEGVDDLDEPRVVIEKGALRHAAKAFAELFEFVVGFRRTAFIDNVDPGQGAHTIDTGRIALWLEVGRLEIRLAQAGFTDIAFVIFNRDLVFDELPFCVAEAEITFVETHSTFGIDGPAMHGWCGAEVGDLVGESVEIFFEKPYGPLGDDHRTGQVGKNAVAHGRTQWSVHAAGHHPRGVYSFLREAFNDLQTKLA